MQLVLQLSHHKAYHIIKHVYNVLDVVFLAHVSYDGVLCDFRFLRMRDFDILKAKTMFLNYLKWREEFRVDTISKVNFYLPVRMFLILVLLVYYSEGKIFLLFLEMILKMGVIDFTR